MIDGVVRNRSDLARRIADLKWQVVGLEMKCDEAVNHGRVSDALRMTRKIDSLTRRLQDCEASYEGRADMVAIEK